MGHVEAELKKRIRAEAALAIYAVQEGREADAYDHLITIDELCSETKERGGSSDGTDRDAASPDDY